MEYKATYAAIMMPKTVPQDTEAALNAIEKLLAGLQGCGQPGTAATAMDDALQLARASLRSTQTAARQRLPCEVSEDEREDADYEGAYECMVRDARAAIRVAQPA